MNKYKLLSLILAVFLVIGFSMSVINNECGNVNTAESGSRTLGVYTAGSWDSADGYKVDGVTVIDGSGNVDAPITSTTGTFSSTLTVTATTTVGTSDLVVQTDLDRIGVGTTTPLDLFQVENSSATTTVIVSSGASAKGGRIIIEDADGAGCSELTTIDGTVAAKTVTCPTGI